MGLQKKENYFPIPHVHFFPRVIFSIRQVKQSQVQRWYNKQSRIKTHKF